MQVVGSHNSKFFALRSASELRLYRGITPGGLIHSNEATLEWARQMDAGAVGELILTGNLGDLYLCGPKGLFRVKNEKGATLERVAPVCACADNAEVRLGRVRVDSEGRDVCYEVIAPDTGIKGKLLGLFKKGKEASQNEARNLFHYSLTTNQQVSYPSFVVEKSKSEMFSWNISPKFRYLVVAQPEKKAYHIQVIDTLEESVTAEFELPLTPLSGLWVNDDGTLLVDVRNEAEERLFVVRQENRKSIRESFTPPRGYRIQYLGSQLIATLFPKARRLVLFKFDGTMAADVELQPLFDMGVVPYFNFSERNDIDVLLLQTQTGVLYVQHSDPKSILIDAKRWALTAREHQMAQEEHYVREATEQHYEERRRLERDQMSRQLAASVSRDDYFFDMETSTGLPGTPVHAAPSVIPPPIASPLPPPTIPAPISVSPTSEAPVGPAGAYAPPSEMATPMESGPKIPPRELLPPAGQTAPSLPAPPSLRKPLPGFSPALPPVAPEPASLSFLTGHMMPPPNTEDDDEAPPPPPVREAPPSPPPAAVAPPPPAPPSSVTLNLSGDLEAELERLRMLYIAGELAREEYYSLRAQVDEAKRKQTPDAAPPRATPPRRLNIEVEPLGPPAAEPGAGSPQGRRMINPLQIDGGT